MEGRRRRQVLRLTLVRLASWLQTVDKPPGLYDLPKELVGDDVNRELAPTDRECKRLAADAPRITQRYCALRNRWTQEQLDAETKEVERLLAEARLWYRASHAVGALRTSLAKLPPDDQLNDARNQTRALLDTFKVPVSDTGEAESNILKARAQARVLDALAQTWLMWQAAGKPDKSPMTVYTALSDRTSEESLKLVAQLHELAAGFEAPRGLLMAVRGDIVPRAHRAAAPSTPDSDDSPWDVSDGDDVGVGADIRRDVHTWDLALFATHALVAVVAFFLPVYVATNFGSHDQYFALFAAGFLGKIAIDQAGPFRSVRLVPATEAKAAEPA